MASESKTKANQRFDQCFGSAEALMRIQIQIQGSTLMQIQIWMQIQIHDSGSWSKVFFAPVIRISNDGSYPNPGWLF